MSTVHSNPVRSLKIKVCGMKDPENMTQLAALKPDFMGLIFYDGSPRFVGTGPAADRLPVFLKNERAGLPLLTGVFVDADPEEIIRNVRDYGLGALQLHGQESPETCRELGSLRPQGILLIKAFGISEQFDWSILKTYHGLADYFLFDTRSGQKSGGTAQQFDWSLLKNYRLDTPYFLSGGISASEFPKVLELAADPRLIGVDLNSRFETAPGIKDIHKLEEAFKLLRYGL